MALKFVSHVSEHAKELYFWTQTLGDDRVKDWALMGSPLPTVILTSIYLIIVRIGPKLMEGRKPLHLRKTLIVYNLSVMLLNLYIGIEIAEASYKLGYSIYCQTVDYSLNYYEFKIAKALWWYYISKLVEFCDTIFFIVRKKNKQLTFLHVYHHSTMFFLWWIGVKYVAGGSSSE